MSNWSAKLSKKYELTLPADVVAWFDGEVWKENSETVFGQPVEPAQLLDSNASTLCGGLMLPDTLLILRNGCGDIPDAHLSVESVTPNDSTAFESSPH